MIIFGYEITTSVATVLLAAATTISAIFTAFSAHHTKKLAQYNKELIAQSEKQHREALRPMCVPTTANDNAIADFGEVIGPYRLLVPNKNDLPDLNSTATIFLHVVNKGVGPATNVRFHINNIQMQRITKDFLVAHVLPPGGISVFLSQIPKTELYDSHGTLIFGMEPGQVINDAYFIVCEYESIFSGDAFHSLVAKGYRDPSLAGDGNNLWRLNRPLTPPVEFRPGLDPSKPIWPLPPEDADYPGAFLNFSSPPENGQST
ncbi:hypothetical protein [Acidithiobacillus ferrooxidans]|jgi:hypothetical protein|uniref:Uncharacterized protein n=1 Tax=Acidithiobacillus ferrooxidans TaxID=920 RepID=A0A2W1KIZ8_ACIFR|nr:hypothetical protein [Acidithiobacillus ferrooxidans]MCR1344073.1 hypothetical protein [Acidithiobacillus ferrooxidans]PZD82445.1 hypothetical protein DN052_05360 [Acidithiobacillus ferrooxidans]QLK41280.1 hypothetical protein FE661_03205 [Acidithiobacillus ferrooxidans]QZT53222.1 hypothetical protein K7B00_03200 [Acidithiobacillus ferrooxidans]RRN86773.1 MAG: hypothetical protein EC577_02885 [Acidithiobacillus ferrooxidans]